jgi:oligopeptide transport system substrate-binding protein
MLEFLEPLFVTGAGADDVGYSNPRFDAAMAAAEAAPDLPQSFAIANGAQRILLRDMPVVPLRYTVAVAGRSPAVSHVALTWNGLPDYEHIVKD